MQPRVRVNIIMAWTNIGFRKKKKKNFFVSSGKLKSFLISPARR